MLIGQVIKRRCKGRITSVTQRLVQGTEETFIAVLTATTIGKGITIASIERLNVTLRRTLALLVRRGEQSFIARCWFAQVCDL